MTVSPIRSLAVGAALVLLSLVAPPAGAQQQQQPHYRGFEAAITRQVPPASPQDPAVVDLTTVVPLPFDLRIRGVTTPTGVTLKGIKPDESDCPDANDLSKCRQRFEMALDAASSKKCTLDGAYVAQFDVTCRGGAPGLCTPGQYQLPFALTSESVCAEADGDASKPR